jgi:predicted dehydrogenase
MKERVTIVTGERGAFVADTLTADLTFYANGLIPTTWDEIASFRGVSEGDVIRYAFPKPEPLRTEHEAFRDAVLGKSTDIVTMRQGLETVAVAEAVLQAASTGRTVDLPEG